MNNNKKLKDQLKEEMESEHFDPNEISEELLSLAGIWQILKDLKTNQKCIIHLSNGRDVSGTKGYFDEKLGIFSIRVPLQIPIQSTIHTDKPELQEVILYSKYRFNIIEGVSTFPDPVANINPRAN